MPERVEGIKQQPETTAGSSKEMVDVQERAKKHEVPREIKTWMEKIEEDPGMANPIGDGDDNQLLTPTGSKNPKVQLPVTKGVFVAGFKKKISEAGRWLSTFILKVIKIKKGNVKFKEG